jgi:hypothetical protein
MNSIWAISRVVVTEYISIGLHTRLKNGVTETTRSLPLFTSFMQALSTKTKSVVSDTADFTTTAYSLAT